MKALTLHQPWASLVAHGVKKIETRSWSTKYRGELAIHAGVHRPEMEMLEDGWGGELYDRAGECIAQWSQTERSDFFPDRLPASPRDRWWIALAPRFDTEPMPLGHIVATCRIAAVLPILDSLSDRPKDFDDYIITDVAHNPDHPTVGVGFLAGGDFGCLAQVPYGDFTPGRFAWLLSDIRPFTTPVEATGRHGLWEWSE